MNAVVELKKKNLQNRFNVPPKVQTALETNDPEVVYEALTPMQQRFVDEYPKDLNASRAAIRAGYKANNANRIGYELMQKEGVRFALDGRMAERAEKTKIDASYVLQKIIKSVERAEESRNEAAVLRGAELLARHLGMFIDKQEISGPEGGAIETQRKLEQDVESFTSAIARLAKSRGTSNDDGDSDAGSEAEA